MTTAKDNLDSNINQCYNKEVLAKVYVYDFFTRMLLCPQKETYSVAVSLLLLETPHLAVVEYMLKGQSHEIFCILFFHKSAHSGPTRDVL